MDEDGFRRDAMKSVHGGRGLVIKLGRYETGAMHIYGDGTVGFKTRYRDKLRTQTGVGIHAEVNRSEFMKEKDKEEVCCYYPHRMKTVYHRPPGPAPTGEKEIEKKAIKYSIKKFNDSANPKGG